MAIVNLTLADTPVYSIDHVTAIGPYFVGIVLSTLLYGIILGQTYTFVTSTRNGGKISLWDSVIVYVSNAFAMGAFVSAVRVNMWLLVENAGVPGAMINVSDQSLYVFQICSALMVAFGQAFFAHRAWKLYSSNKPLGVVLAFGVVWCLASNLAYVGKTIILQRQGLAFIVVVGMISTYTSIAYISAAVFDIIVCLLISCRVVSARQGYNKSTDSILARIASVTISTSALTSICALLIAIFIQTTSDATYWVVTLVQMMPRLFLFSVLFVIVNRDLIAGRSPTATGKPSGYVSNGASFVPAISRVHFDRSFHASEPSVHPADLESTPSTKDVNEFPPHRRNVFDPDSPDRM